MGILRRTHRLLLLLTILSVAGVLRTNPVRTKRQAANRPWNYYRNMYRQRFMNRRRLANNRLVGPRRGPLLMNNQGQTGMNNQGQTGMNNQRLFNNRRFVYPPSNYPMNNRFQNNFGQTRRQMFIPWRNNRILNQGPLMIPGPGYLGMVQNTPVQDPTDAPEWINGVLVTELPEPPDPTDPPEIPLAQSPQIPASPYANMFWPNYGNPTFMGQGGPVAEITDPPDPPDPTEPPEFFPAPASTVILEITPAPTILPLPTPIPQAAPTGSLAPRNTSARIQPRLSTMQQAAPRANGSSANEYIGTGTPPTVDQVGPWASQPRTSPLTPVVVADIVPNATQYVPVVDNFSFLLISPPPILPLTTPAVERSAVEVMVSPSSKAVTPSGVSYMYSPRRGYNPTWTMGTNLAPWQRVMWNRMLYNV